MAEGPDTSLTSVGIVGLGLMGGSLALALASDPAVRVRGVDAEPSTLERARALGLDCSAALESIRGCQVIVLAVPLGAMRHVLAELAPVAGDSVVTDLTSTKAPVVGWARAAGVDLLPGHPMCGRENSGIGAADADLYRNAPWLLGRPGALVEEMVRKVGARPMVIPIERQDELVAGVSHTAYLVAVGYLLALSDSDDWDEMAPLAGSGFRDTTRLAASDPSLFTSVILSNAVNVAAWLDRVIAQLREVRNALEEDPAELRQHLENAARTRRAWAQEREHARLG